MKSIEVQLIPVITYSLLTFSFFEIVYLKWGQIRL